MTYKTLAVVCLLTAALASLIWYGATVSARQPAPATALVQGCNAITINSIASQGVAGNQGEKVTVAWTFAAPTGVGGPCVKVDGFKVKIVVKRKNGNTNERNIDASASAREVNATFADSVVNSPIESATATVVANFSGSATTTKAQGL